MIHNRPIASTTYVPDRSGISRRHIFVEEFHRGLDAAAGELDRVHSAFLELQKKGMLEICDTTTKAHERTHEHIDALAKDLDMLYIPR